MVSEIAREVGSQSVVVVLDVKKAKDGTHAVWTHNAKKNTAREALATIADLERLGAGEVVVNSIDSDGVVKGYDLLLARGARSATRLPLTVLGGAGSLGDIGKLIAACGVVGAAAGSLFVFKGVYRAVLINYPNPAQKDELIRAALTEGSVSLASGLSGRPGNVL